MKHENEILLRRADGATLLDPRVVRLAILTTIAALLLDFATKSWAIDSLNGTTPFGALLLGIEHNAAFAFSAGAGLVSRELVAGVRLGALAALVLLATVLGVRERRHAAGVGLILGGGLGNTGDLIFRTHGVVDFIGVGPFEVDFGGRDVVFGLVFNAADVAVLVGVVLLTPVIQLWAIAAQTQLARARRWLNGQT